MEDYSDHISFFSTDIWQSPDLFYVKFHNPRHEDCILPYFHDLALVEGNIKYGPHEDV